MIGQAVSEKKTFEIVDGRRRRATTTDAEPWVSIKLTYEPLAKVSLKGADLPVWQSEWFTSRLDTHRSVKPYRKNGREKRDDHELTSSTYCFILSSKTTSSMSW